MNCPKCGHEYFCHCKACRERQQDKVPFIVLNMDEKKDNWDEQCPICGFTESVHWWFDEQFRQYKPEESL